MKLLSHPVTFPGKFILFYFEKMAALWSLTQYLINGLTCRMWIESDFMASKLYQWPSIIIKVSEKIVFLFFCELIKHND